MCWPSPGPAEGLLIAEDAYKIIRHHSCAPACRLPHHSSCNHVFHIGRARACSQVTRPRRNLAVRVHNWNFLQTHESISLIDPMLLNHNLTIACPSPDLPPANWFGMPNKRSGVVRAMWCSWVNFVMVLIQFWVFFGCFYASGKMKRDSWMCSNLILLPISEMSSYPFPGNG